MTAAEISAALGMAQRRGGWWPCQVHVARRKQIGSERHRCSQAAPPTTRRSATDKVRGGSGGNES